MYSALLVLSAAVVDSSFVLGAKRSTSPPRIDGIVDSEIAEKWLDWNRLGPMVEADAT